MNILKPIAATLLATAAVSATAGSPADTRADKRKAVIPIAMHGLRLETSQDAAIPRRPAVQRLDGVPPVKTRLGVLKTFDSNWTTSTDAGYYIVDAEDGTLHPQKISDGMANIFAAVKKGDIMYAITLSDDMESVWYSSMSTSTWNTIGSRQEIDFVNIPTDLTLDPTTGEVYGFFYCEEDYVPEYRNFANFNLVTAEASSIRIMEREVYACAADGLGTVYWLSSTQLGDIDTSGIDFNYRFGPRIYPTKRNTMTYDPDSGLLYAFVTTDEMIAGVRTFYTTFYSIDPVNETVTSIRRFDNEQGYAGLFMLPVEIADNAPGKVSNVSFAFNGDNPPMGTVTLTAPSVTHTGSPLTENVTIIVEVGGVEYGVFDVAPGATITTPEYPFAEGNQQVTITAATAAERGESVVIDVFAGRDIPAAPQQVTLTADADGHPVITWQPVTSGASNGAIDLPSLRYRVERSTDGATVASALTATTYTDMTYTPAGRAVSYRVYASTIDGESQPGESNRMAIGTEVQLPYNEPFDNADNADLWTIINTNGGSTWAYDSTSASMEYRYDDNMLAADDWCISPGLRLEADKIYSLSYDYRALMSSYPESFEVAIGSSPSVSAMTRTLASHSEVKNTRLEKNTVTFSVDNDGVYHIGWHATSEPYEYVLQIDNIAVSEIDSSLPAAPTLSVAAGERGALSATATVTLPAVDADGKELTEIGSLVFGRTDVAAPLQTVPAPTPGATLTLADNNVPASGSYIYYAYCTAAAGNGPESRVSLYVGVDVPDAVNNLTLTEKDGHPYLTWTAPTAGRNGGWFDPQSLTYTVYRYFDDMDAIAEGITATEVTDMTLTVPAGTQKPISYAVFPYAGGKAGRAIESDYILFGDPFAAPLTENFSRADMDYFPWMSVTDVPLHSAWTLDAAGYNPTASDYTGDNGLATFHSAGETETGVGSWFMSPKIDISTLTHPSVSWAMYHSSIPDIATAETMQVFATVDGGEYIAVSPVYNRDNGTTGWTRYSADLGDLPDGEWIRLAFKGTTAGGADIYIDGVTVEEARSIDLAVTGADLPSKVAADEPVTLDITVTNLGTAPAAAASLTVSIDGAEIASLPVEPLANGARTSLSTPLSIAADGDHNVEITVTAAGDEVTDNNTMTVAVTAVQPVLPAPTGLTANVSAANGVTLGWRAADAMGAVCDSFETYTDWSIDNIGDWRMIDRDLDNTVYINAAGAIPGAMGEYPHCTDPKAWQICNAAAMGINIWPQGTPHNGDKMLMASASVNYVNSDWAISPRLNGQAQMLSFFAKSFTTDGIAPERMRVLYSTGGHEPSDFTPLHSEEYIEVGESWTEYRYSLPQDTRYFAIECVSDGSFALFVDDVCYNDATVPRATLTGYKVIRNGEVIATTADCSYTDTSVSGEKATYAIRAVYDKGTADSAPVEVTLSSVAQPAADTVTVTAGDREIIVTGAAGMRIRIADTAGRILRDTAATETAVRIPVDSGIYLVTVGSKTCKIVII